MPQGVNGVCMVVFVEMNFVVASLSYPLLSTRHTTASQTNQAPAACIDSHALTHAHPDHQVREINCISSFIVPLFILEL